MNKKYLYAALGLTVLVLVVSVFSGRGVEEVDVVVTPPVVTSTITIDGTVKGTVTLSPVCPVERMPPDPKCAPRAYQTDVQILDSVGSKILMTLHTKIDGSFSVILKQGNYQAKAVGGNPYPRCSTESVHVLASTTVSVALSCDTGIR